MKHLTVLLFFLITVCSQSYAAQVGLRQPKRSELATQKSAERGEKLFKYGFNRKKKEAEIKELVEKASLYLSQHELSDACLKFTRKKEFVLGDTYLFVFDLKGRLLAHGEQVDFLFADRLEEKDAFGFSYVKEIIRVAQNGGGWVTYSWRDAIKITYVQLVSKGSESFIVGAGYYPHAKKDFAVSMVKGAVTLFNKLVLEENYPVVEPFSTMNYPRKSKASLGDLYIYALDFEGNVYAHADRPELAAETNMLDYQDATGRYINKEAIQALEKDKAIWTKYISKNAVKETYIEWVMDKEGKKYFIACGYYPEANQEQAEILVGKAIQYMEGHGKDASVRAFSSDTFRYGDLYIVVYDLKGTIVAHGWNESLIGSNVLDKKDQDGTFYIKELIELGQKGGGWVNAKLHNAFQSTYVEMVTLGLEKYVVSCSFFPISKQDAALLLLNSAISSLKSGDFRSVIRSFSEVGGPFIRGDLKIFVIDLNGICYVWGDNYRLIWKDLSSLKDQKGNPFVQYMIESTAQGPSKIAYTLNNQEAVALVERCEIDGKVYIVGSPFYL